MNTGAGSGTDFLKETEQMPLGPRKNRATGKGRKEKPVSRPRHTEGRSSHSSPSRKIPFWLAELLNWGVTLIVSILVVLGVNYYVFSLSTVEGHSMQPTLYEKEWLFVNKISYLLGSPRNGEVVILRDPAQAGERKEFLVKRIVAGPGEVVEIRQGELYRDGALIVEPYTDVMIQDSDYGPVTVPADHYFVMGDNRHASASRDSRSFQAVERKAILRTGQSDSLADHELG